MSYYLMLMNFKGTAKLPVQSRTAWAHILNIELQQILACLHCHLLRANSYTFTNLQYFCLVQTHGFLYYTWTGFMLFLPDSQNKSILVSSLQLTELNTFMIVFFYQIFITQYKIIWPYFEIRPNYFIYFAFSFCKILYFSKIFWTFLLSCAFYIWIYFFNYIYTDVWITPLI